MKELLLNSKVSKAREFTTFSMNAGSDFDPWNLKLADFLFIHSTLEITLGNITHSVFCFIACWQLRLVVYCHFNTHSVVYGFVSVQLS